MEPVGERFSIADFHLLVFINTADSSVKNVVSGIEREHMLEWFFVLFLNAATFGGDFEVRFYTSTEEGCRKLERVVLQEASNMRIKYTYEECRHEVS